MTNINVNYQPSHWKTGEEDLDFWRCQHPEDAIDTDDTVRFYMSGITGMEPYEDTITICRACGGQFNGVEDRWEECELPEACFNV